MYGETSRNVSRSTADSSVHTLNSVDPPTEPSLSDDRSVYTTHTSFSSYASSSSYAAEPCFTVADCHDAHAPSHSRPEICTPTPDDSGVLCMYMQTPKKNTRLLPSLAPPLDLSHGSIVQKPLPPIPAASSRQLGGSDRRVSTVAPLPEPGHIRKTSARYRCDPPEPTSRCATPLSPSSRPSSTRSRSSSYTQESAEGGRKRAASYSLFPRTPSTGQQKLPINGMPSPPATGTVTTTPCSPRCTSTSTDAGRGNLTRSPPPPPPPPPSRDPRRNGKVLSLGTSLAPGPTEELQAPQIPSTGGEFSHRPPLRVAGTPGQSVLQRQKSMPCLVRPWTPSSGPPPTDPLPALPPVASGCLPLPQGHHERMNP
ncbi:uncharacterized protein PV07_12367 [Cladophialophora immunda]|uniref:Uncharacterized protein n=1 Tax=Cladophialophora immunda TaxID=569365 RepID=A0A0D2BTY7_9EURO|nr:uncharacterized protein PV07_12367 [Cladophialophora immunda]KIW22483.1 hypothetical protein PV07_12367 [Cladophialophora immunda]